MQDVEERAVNIILSEGDSSKGFLAQTYPHLRDKFQIWHSMKEITQEDFTLAEMDVLFNYVPLFQGTISFFRRFIFSFTK